MTAQCPAYNGAMEGHQCHGDQGHRGLHWIEFDDGVSEWGDNDKLWDEIDRLRVVIENAPHGCLCRAVDASGELVNAASCDCWKADAL